MSNQPESDGVEAPASDPTEDRTIIGSLGNTIPLAGRLGEGQEWIGRTLGRYRLTGMLGGGGMGVVYRARDEVIERDVAVKMLPPDLAAQPTAFARFLKEARAGGRLSHSNTVALYEIGEQDGTHFLVMELVTGGSLSEEVQRIGPLSPVAATRAIADAARGLAAAHVAGLVHRDVKPANLLRTQDGSVKVCDFGLAKDAFPDGGNVTKAGHVVGTPFYMSPEQCEGRQATAQSDVYSLGATYYFLLTGVDPYSDAGSTVKVMFAHCHGEPLDPRTVNMHVPEECAAIIGHAVAKSPLDRYPSAGEMLRDLEGLLARLSGGGSGFQTRLRLSGVQGSGVQSAAATDKAAAVPAAPRQLNTSWLAAAGGLMLLGCLVAGVIWISRNIGKTEGNQDASYGAVTNRNSTNGGAKNAAVLATGADTVVAPVAGGEPIRIGVLYSLSGVMADSEAPVVDAVLLAIDEVNRAGGVLGRPLNAVIADGRSDPQIFLREAERLIDVEQVPVVFGCWTSATRKTVVPLFEDRDHLLVYSVQHEGLAESPNVLYTGATPNQQILPAVTWSVESLHAKRFYVVGTDSVFPRSAGAILNDAAEDLEIEIVGETYLSSDIRSFEETAGAIAANRPDVILNLIDGTRNAGFFDSLRQAGIRPGDIPTISFRIGEAELRRLDVSNIAGDYAAWSYFEGLDIPENKVFLAAFHERYGPQRAVTAPMECAYVGVKLWAAAANQAGSVEPRAVRPAIRNQRMNSPEGPVRVEAISQHLFKTPRIGQIRDDGQITVIWQADRPVPPEPYPTTRSAEEWKRFLRDLQRGWGGRWAASE